MNIIENTKTYDSIIYELEQMVLKKLLGIRFENFIVGGTIGNRSLEKIVCINFYKDFYHVKFLFLDGAIRGLGAGTIEDLKEMLRERLLEIPISEECKKNMEIFHKKMRG